MGILSDFFRFWEPTWLQNGGKLGIENALLLSLTEKGENPKSAYFSNRFNRFLIFFGFGWSKIGAKNRSKIYETTTSTWESILASIFYRFLWILVVFERQVGTENRAKIDEKKQRKTMKKWTPPSCQKSRKESQQEKIWSPRRLMPQALGSAVGRVGRGNSELNFN